MLSATVTGKNNTQTIASQKEQEIKPKQLSPPPFIVEDTQILFYDITLLVNLCVCISTLVIHRNASPMLHIIDGFSEGSLLSLIWLVSGLWNGAFLYSAADGHYPPSAEESPKRAGLLAFNTFVTTMNIRILLVLIDKFVLHKAATNGAMNMILLELVFGLGLMSFWRMLRSYIIPR